MSSRNHPLPYLQNSLLSESEVKVIDIMSYQFGQYEGRDGQTLAAALGLTAPCSIRKKVRLTEAEISKRAADCVTLHEKLHVLVNTFVLTCRMYGFDFDLTEHIVEISNSEITFCTPSRILVEPIIYEKLKH